MKPYMILLLALLITPMVSADISSTLHYNVVSLQESVQVEVDNNLMHARVVVRHDGPSAKAVARLINIDMQWALQRVQQYKTVKAQTLNYSTYPQYKDHKIRSWSGRQEMSLASEDFTLLTHLIGDLQERLQVNNIRFSVSAKKYKQVEDSLIAEAVKAFNKKAHLITKAMEKKAFDVVNMDVNTNRYYAQPIARKSMRAEIMQADSMMPEPAVAAGTNSVRVNVSGQIQTK